MRNRSLSREEALEEYLIYRKRLREFLDMAQIAADIKKRKYKPRDLLGRGPERFSEVVGDALMGLFASLMDRHGSALNVSDVWLVLFPKRKDQINQTWEEVNPHVQLIRDYRNKVVCHASNRLVEYVNAHLTFTKSRGEIVKAIQGVAALAVQLLRDEPTALPDLRAEIGPILKKLWPDLRDEKIEGLKDYFLQKERAAD